MSGRSRQRAGSRELRPFAQSLPMALLRARESTMRMFRPMLAEHDLTEQQWRVLRALSAADGPLEVNELAERTFLLGPSLSRILVNLEGRGLLDRAPAPHDLRRSLISVSRAGERLVRAVGPQSERLYARLEERFGEARLRELVELLRLLGDTDLLAEEAT